MQMKTNDVDVNGYVWVWYLTSGGFVLNQVRIAEMALINIDLNS